MQSDGQGSPAARRGPLGWPRRRQIATAAYLVALVVLIALTGVPTLRPVLVAIVLTGLATTTIGKGPRRLWEVLRDWVPFSLVLILYDQSRKLANNFGIPVHERDTVRAEKWLFDGTTPTVWLQHHLYSPDHVYWYDALCTLVYTSHFLATPILAAVLWLRDRAIWLAFITRVIVLAVAGLITYVVFPAAPPWLAAKDGLIAPVVRLSARGWQFFGFDQVGSLLVNAQNGPDANPVAAMPSLHIAFATLVAIFVGGRFRSRWRWLAVLYPMAMGFTLVYTGEHWVLDLIAGVVYALGAHFAVGAWERRRRRLRAGTAPERERLDGAPVA